MKAKTFLVVAGSGYIGQAVVSSLIDEGHNVIATFHTKKPKDSPNVQWLNCDLTSDSGLDNLSQALKGLKVPLDGLALAVGGKIAGVLLPNNERLNFFRSFEHDPEWLAQLFQIYGVGTYGAIKLALPYLQKSPNPNIVIVGSLIGIKAVNSPLCFAAAKGSTRGLVESLSKDLGQINIKVNSVDPGMLEAGASTDISNQLKQEYLKHCALRRFGTAQEVANAIHWFLDENTYITGQAIVLDGAL